jgi:hypothetical protein
LTRPDPESLLHQKLRKIFHYSTPVFKEKVTLRLTSLTLPKCVQLSKNETGEGHCAHSPFFICKHQTHTAYFSAYLNRVVPSQATYNPNAQSEWMLLP